MAVTIQNLVKGESDWHLKINSNNEAIQTALNNFDSSTTYAKQTDLDTTNSKLDDALNPLTVTLSINPGISEKGSVVNSQVLTWTCSKDIASQTLDGATIANTLRTYTDTTATSSDKTHTLICTTTGGTSVTKTITLSFANDIFYGTSTSTTFDSSLISSLTKTLSNSKNKNYTVNASTGQYIYFCYSKDLGTSSFSCNGFSGGFSLAATVSFTNSSGLTTDFYVYKSDNASLGSTTFTVS